MIITRRDDQKKVVLRVRECLDCENQYTTSESKAAAA